MSAIFKETYRGYGIYWHGADGYGDETNAWGNTVAQCRQRIDSLLVKQEQAARLRFDGAELKGFRDGDGARIEYRGNVVFTGTIREVRRSVFDLEDRYGADIVWE